MNVSTTFIQRVNLGVCLQRLVNVEYMRLRWHVHDKFEGFAGTPKNKIKEFWERKISIFCFYFGLALMSEAIWRVADDVRGTRLLNTRKKSVLYVVNKQIKNTLL